MYIRSIFPTIGRAHGPGGSLYFHFLMSLLIINPVTSPISTVLMVNQLRIVSSILFLYQLCLKERKKSAIGCVLVDFRKAFDLVDHKLHLQMLKHYKINKLSLSWFESYLSHRIQQVNINTNQSKTGSGYKRTTGFHFRSSVIFYIYK